MENIGSNSERYHVFEAPFVLRETWRVNPHGARTKNMSREMNFRQYFMMALCTRPLLCK